MEVLFIRTGIMFVCHGNICRSPMAEFIMKDLTEKRGISDRVCIASCAVSTEEIWQGVGNPVHPAAKRELEKHGLSCGGKRAVQLKAGDYDKYDMFICMDSQNVRGAVRILGGDPEKKVRKLLSFTGSDRDVSDPWYTGQFDIAYGDIYDGCLALCDMLING